MAKGYCTAGVAVLFDSTPSIEAIAAALDGFELARVEPTRASEPRWAGGMPFVLVAFRPEVNGYVIVEIADRPWPDDMGQPDPEHVELFAAWSMGFFGPFVFPGNLARAIQMAMLCRPAAAAAGRHRAFVRIRASYILGASEVVPVIPPAYDPLAELGFVTRIARALLEVPNALAYFNPNGEILSDAATIDELHALADQQRQVPLELWSNVRMMRGDDRARYLVMDTIGMPQLGVQDNEACFPGERIDPNDVAPFSGTSATTSSSAARS